MTKVEPGSARSVNEDIEQSSQLEGFNQAALALEHARRLETERAARQQAETLRAAMQALSTSLDLPTVLSVILTKLQEVVPYDNASVQELRGNQLEIIGGVGFSHLDKVRGVTFPITSNANPHGQVIDTHQTLIVNNVSSSPYPDFRRELHDLGRVNSWMGVPLLFGNRAIGMITLEKREPNFYTDGQAQIALTFAAQAAIAIHNAQAYIASQEYAAENAALYRATVQLLNPDNDLTALAERIAMSVTREFDLANCAVMLPDETRTALWRVARAGKYQIAPGPPLRLDGPGLIVYAFQTGQVVYVPEVSVDPRYLCRDSRTRSELAMPLRCQDRVIGVLDLQSPEPNSFDQRAQRIVTAFAQQAALALENVRLLTAERAARQQAETMQAAMQALSASLDLPVVLNIILAKLHEVVPFNIASVLELNQDSLRIIQGIGNSDHNEANQIEFEITHNAYPHREVVETRKPLIVADVCASRYSAFQSATPEAVGTRSWLGVPLLFGDQVLGMITLGKTEPNFYSQAQASLALSFAAQAAIGLHNARLYAEAQKYAAENAALYRASSQMLNSVKWFGQYVARSFTSPQLPSVLVEGLIHQFQADTAVLYLVQESKLILAGSSGSWSPPGSLAVTLPELAELNQPMFLSRTSSGPAWLGALWASGQIEMVAPLLGLHEPMGLLGVGRRAGEVPFSARDMDAVEIVAQQCALFLQAADQLETLRRRPLEIEQAQEEERQRIAIDLHDNVQQFLAGLQFPLELSRKLLTSDPAKADAYLSQMTRDVDRSAKILRQISHNLMPRDLQKGLREPLQALVEEYRMRHALNIQLAVPEDLDSDLGVDERYALRSVVRQALDNIVAHAHAAQVDIEFTKVAPDRLAFSVTDDGDGFSDAEREQALADKRIGLTSMSARIAAVRGEFQVVSAPGEGTTVFGWVPSRSGFTTA